MSKGSLMKDPSFVQIIYAVEKRIYDFDKAAQREGVHLTDSNVKSAIRQALGRLKGKPPKGDAADEREKRIMILGEDLTAFGSVQQVKTSDYVNVLLAVEDSLKAGGYEVVRLWG
ncbi:MAG: hypothetical protein MUC65_09510, partial [Pontiellaceae bacterium]|nr:hypothetical protein [Pontiellaceae bacterium]